MNFRRATRAPSDHVRRRWHLAAIGLAAGFAATVAGCGGVQASELEPFTCRGSCAPLAPTQLESYRAQGLSVPPDSETKLGVILWDEYRRVRQPRDTSEGIAGRVSYQPAVAAH